jgi:hypothetical protein
MQRFQRLFNHCNCNNGISLRFESQTVSTAAKRLIGATVTDRRIQLDAILSAPREGVAIPWTTTQGTGIHRQDAAPLPVQRAT